MPAIPPAHPNPRSTVYQKQVRGSYTDLLASVVGNKATAQDGFDANFTPAANAYPGPDFVSKSLGPDFAAVNSDLGTLGANPDPALDGDIESTALLGQDLMGGYSDLGVTVPETPLPAFPSLSSIPPGSLAPSFIQSDTQTAEREIQNTFVKITDAGTVSWYVQDTEPGPIKVYVSKDGADWQEFAEGFEGRQTPEWIVPGSFYAFEWRNPNGIIAQAYIDLRDPSAQTAVIQQPSAGGAAGGGVTQSPNYAGPTQIPDVPAGLSPSGTLLIADSGMVTWSTTNVKEAGVFVSIDGQTPVVFALQNNGTGTAAWMQAPHTYDWSLMDLSNGMPGVTLDSSRRDLSAVTPAGSGQTSTAPPPQTKNGQSPAPIPPTANREALVQIRTAIATPQTPPPPPPAPAPQVKPINTVLSTRQVSTPEGKIQVETRQGVGGAGSTYDVTVSGPAFVKVGDIPLDPNSNAVAVPGYVTIRQNGAIIGYALNPPFEPLSVPAAPAPAQTIAQRAGIRG